MSIAHQLFADLCEGLLAEDSTSINLLRGLPGAEQLVKKMHQRGKPSAGAENQPLPHDQEYTQVKTPPWSELKGHREGGFGRWLLVRAENGAAVIWAPGGGSGYEAFVYHDGEIERKYDDRGGNILDWIKQHAGKINAYYLGKVSKDIGAKRGLRRERAPRAQVGDDWTNVTDFTTQLITRFKPLWLRAVQGAVADIKGWMNTQIKNDNYHAAESKLNSLSRLKQVVDAIESGENIPASDSDTSNLIKTAVHNAIQLATAHHYPELAGEWQQQQLYGFRGSSARKITNAEAIKQLFTDIRSGDTAKLGTVLSYFKNQLVRNS